jgi:hypothetical protein
MSDKWQVPSRSFWRRWRRWRRDIGDTAPQCGLPTTVWPDSGGRFFTQATKAPRWRLLFNDHHDLDGGGAVDLSITNHWRKHETSYFSNILARIVSFV